MNGNFKDQVKKIIVDTAKEWPTYFAKLFPVAVSIMQMFTILRNVFQMFQHHVFSPAVLYAFDLEFICNF